MNTTCAKILTTLAALAWGAACTAQTTFIRTYGPAGLYTASCSALAADGGMVLAGAAQGINHITRLDPYGNIIWSHTYDAPVDATGTYDQEYFRDVMLRPNGDVLVVGSGVDTSNWIPDSREMMACFDSLGDLLWATKMNSLYSEAFLSTTLYAADQALVGNHRGNALGQSGDVFLVDLDDGSIPISWEWDDPYEAGITGLELSPDGGLLVISGRFIHKMGLTFAPLWARGWSLFQPTHVAGSASGCTVALAAEGVIRVDAVGNIQWAHTITTTPGCTLADLAMRPNGDILLLGRTAAPDRFSFLLELDSTGALQWAQRYGAPGDTVQLDQLHLLADGSMRMVGTTNGQVTVVAVDAVGQLASCTFPPVSPVLGTLNLVPSTPAGGTMEGPWIPDPHEEVRTAQYVPGTIVCAGPSPGLLATGIQFFDVDEDGVPDPTDTGVPFAQLSFAPPSGNLFTLMDGSYVLTPLDSGTFTLTGIPPAPWWQLSTDSASYTVTLNSLNPQADSLFFGWYPLIDTTLVEFAFVAASTTGCLNPTHHWITVENMGTTRPDLVLALQFDPLLTFSTAQPAPDSLVGSTLYWHMDTLGHFQVAQVQLTFEPPSAQYQGDSVQFALTVTEVDSLGNLVLLGTDMVESLISCSYDPNDKQVEPVGVGPLHGIAPDTEWLTYTIRFQNTGNDTAHTVVIEDPLSTHLDRSSLQVLGASHTLTGASLNGYGLATFHFDGIMLPDSNVNEPASHGFVRFRVKPVQGLPHLTAIDNLAGIIFDQNAPVITNTVRNTIIDCVNAPAPVVIVDGLWLYHGSVFEPPPPPSFSFQWLLNGDPVPGATFAYLYVSQSGMYQLALTDPYDGCTVLSAPINMIVTGVSERPRADVHLVPNPFNDQARVILDRPCGTGSTLGILDAHGRLVRTLRGNGTNTLTIDRGDLAPGLYVLRVDSLRAVRFVVE